MERSNVRTKLTRAACVTATIFLFAVHAQAQNQQAPPPQQQAPRGASPPSAGNHPIAVVDITYILDHYPRLKADMETYKRDFESTGASFKKEQEALVKKAEALKGLKAGSPDYKKLEEELAQRESDLKVKAALKQKEFAEAESKIYLRAYQDVSTAIRVYSERHNIQLVLRFSGAPADPNNRDAVRAELLKTVQYSHRDIDITDPILAELNRNAAVASPQNSPARPAAPRR
jgi:Skp family chaperone for outer membrane proteins